MLWFIEFELIKNQHRKNNFNLIRHMRIINFRRYRIMTQLKPQIIISIIYSLANECVFETSSLYEITIAVHEPAH